MKKTLIALMALAGVAMGAVVEDHLAIEAEYTTAPVFGGDCWSKDYVLTFTLAADYTLEHGGNIVAGYWGSDQGTNSTAGGGYVVNAVYLSGTNEALTLNVGNGITNVDLRGAGVEITNAVTFNNQRGTTFADVLIERGVTYTVSVTGSDWAGGAGGMTPTLSWTNASGEIESVTAAKYNGNTNGGGKMAVGDVFGYKVNTEYIPEPATATLSLLALAGLAARRRRK